jgi:hypothetical protein
MADRMSTAARMDNQRARAKVSRIENGTLKRKERAARAVRMKELLAKGTFPYTPAIMSWVSEQLGKPAKQVTEAEAKALAK